jgi:hypothetical protein
LGFFRKVEIMGEEPSNNGIIRDEKGRFVKGSTAQGKGRPKGSLSLIGLLKKKLEEIEPQTKRQYAYLLIERIVKKAISEGDDAQIKNILQYIEGMPKQPIEHSGEIKTNEPLSEKELDAKLRELDKKLERDKRRKGKTTATVNAIEGK